MKAHLVLTSILVLLTVSACSAPSTNSSPEARAVPLANSAVQAASAGSDAPDAAKAAGPAMAIEPASVVQRVEVPNGTDPKIIKGEETVPMDVPAVRAARHAYAVSKGISDDEVRVVSAEAVSWPDRSLGCPMPGTDYLQVITPGYRVVLAAGSEQVEYHTSDGGNPMVVLCNTPTIRDAAPIR